MLASLWVKPIYLSFHLFIELPFFSQLRDICYTPLSDFLLFDIIVIMVVLSLLYPLYQYPPV